MANTTKNPKGREEEIVKAQVDTNQAADQPDAQEALKTGTLKAEQPIREEVPDYATVVREYAKWTDNDGNFHKVPIDGTTAIREPAHEQHELTIEDRDNVDQALALKTPRREEGADQKVSELQDMEIRNDRVNSKLTETTPVTSVAPAGEPTGPRDDENFGKNDGENVPE